MPNDQQDTTEEGLAAFDSTQEEQDGAAANASNSEEEGQDAAAEDKLYAGKFKSVEDLEHSYEEIQRFAGSRKDLEAKATAYDRLVASQAQAAGQSRVGMPKLSSYVLQDGAIDVAKYDAHMETWQTQQANDLTNRSQAASQESADMLRAEREFDYLRTDPKAAKQVIALYRAGMASSIYEAAKDFDETYRSGKTEAEKLGEAKAKAELSKQSRGNTERAGGKVADVGEMTNAKFQRLTAEQQREFINNQFKQGTWK